VKRSGMLSLDTQRSELESFMEPLLRREAEAAARRPKSKRSGREEEREESGPAVPGEDSIEASRDRGKAEKTGWKAKKKKIEKLFKDRRYQNREHF
jgi:hypothetical protein